MSRCYEPTGIRFGLDRIVTSGPSRAATGGFPYAHRTVAEVWADAEAHSPAKWCAQCETRVKAIEAGRCRNRWCAMKAAA